MIKEESDSKVEEEPERNAITAPIYDVYIFSEIEKDETETSPSNDVDSSFASKFNVYLQKLGLITFYRKSRMPLNQLSPIIIASKFVLLLVNESLISKLTDDRDLCEEFDDLVSKHHIKNIIFLVKQEMKEYWTGRVREFTPTQVFYWSETIDNYEKIIEELVARFVDLPSSQNQLAEKEREKIYGRIESIISLLASTEELLSLLQSEEISKFSIHFLDLDGHSVVNTYFFLFLNQFTINFLSTEDFFGEVSSNDLKDMMGQTFSVPLMEAFRHYEEILCCSGGDYGQLHINGSLLDYFELKIYGPHGTVRKEEETLSSFVSRLQSSSSTVEEYSHQNTPTRNMTASASTLKKLKYFLIKGIFLILYFELKLIYQAWEFLLFQVMVDIVPVQMVLETLTSCRVKDFQTEFWLVKAFSSERVRKNFLSQRYHPLKKEEKVSHLLKNNFESNQNSPENESRLFRELSQVYDNDEHHEKMYHLCGSIHRHRDRWINTHIIQATTITEKEKKLLICEFDKATKWIGYSINLTGSFMSSTFEIFKDFRELYKRKNILLKEWKQNIIVFIQTLFLSNLQDWIFPLLYLLVESIYCSQLLITHLTQLNLFQLPYHFEVCQQDESRLKLFQLPANNYEYHIEITELYQILIDSYSDFTAFHRQEDWVKLLHFPFSLGVDDNTADLKLIQKYLEKRGNSSLENYAMEVLRISETTALIEKLSLIFHQETERFEITQYRLIGFEIKDFLFKISNNILIFNSVFMGDPTNFLKLCSNDFLEIHLTVRKYICSEVDYIFFIYLVWLSNLFLPNLNQENLSSLFQKDQVKDRVIFPFLFDKLSSHYVNQFYAVMEILAQRDSSLYTVKSDTQIPLLCVLVRFMNDVNSDFDEERRIYEFLNEIRIAIRSHTIFTRVRRNIRSEGAPKKRVNSQKSLNKSLEGTKREKEDLYDYSYLNNFEQFIDRVYRYFKRKYAKDTEIPETELKECLKKLYLYALNKDESTMNESFLINLHQTAFPSELHEFLGIARVEALRGLAVVIVVATLLQRHSFFQGSIMPNSSSTSGSNPHIYERNWILTVFTYWLAEYDPDHHIQDNPEEYGRLARFYHICTIVFNLFHTGRRLKRMYIFVGACIEGIPDEIFRVYSLGAERTELTKRREHIFMRITGLSPRKRGTKPKNSYLGAKFKRKRIGSSSFDEIQHGKTSTKTQHESSENEKEDDYDDDDDDDDDNEQITEQEFTLSSRDCYKYIPEWTD